MANLLQSVPILVGLLPALLLVSGGFVKTTNGQAPGQGAWCIARPSTSEETLMKNIAFACETVDCSVIQPRGDCYHPLSLMSHASVVMNLYYQKLGKNYWNCDFNSSAVVVITDPSYGDCKFECA